MASQAPPRGIREMLVQKNLFLMTSKTDRRRFLEAHVCRAAFVFNGVASNASLLDCAMNMFSFDLVGVALQAIRIFIHSRRVFAGIAQRCTQQADQSRVDPKHRVPCHGEPPHRSLLKSSAFE